MVTSTLNDSGSPPLIHLIVGSTGAGKTTYALDLARQLRAVRFSIDDWMTTLYWMDSPNPVQYEWAMERIARCESLIAANVLQLAALGIPSLLDLGFTRAAHRAKFTRFASDNALRAQLHFVDVAHEERWLRVSGRNTTQGETFRMHVDRPMFDFMKSIWEPPTPEEMETFEGVRVPG